MCPSKGFIKLGDAKQCTKCMGYYHSSCSIRTICNDDGSFDYCCSVDKSIVSKGISKLSNCVINIR